MVKTKFATTKVKQEKGGDKEKKPAKKRKSCTPSRRSQLIGDLRRDKKNALKRIKTAKRDLVCSNRELAALGVKVAPSSY